MAPITEDPLLLLRQSIAENSPITPTTSSDATSVPAPVSLSEATHLHFGRAGHGGPVVIALDTPTRFVSNGREVALRSVYFAWLNREVAIPLYNASASRLNEELAGRAAVQNLAFVERLDLITWLEGAADEGEYIKPLPSAAGGDAAAGASAAVAGAGVAGAGRGALDPRLQAIYNGERKMGDHNSILRGIKPTASLPHPRG